MNQKGKTVRIDKTIINMDFMTMNIVKSQKIRTPLDTEIKSGLWIDRIGHAANVKNDFNTLRILGLYAVVYIDRGEGLFYSESSGELNVNTGDTILLFPNIPHMYSPLYEWETRWIVWSGNDAETFEKLSFFSPQKPLVKGNIDAVPRAYETLFNLIGAEDIFSIFKRKSILLNMLLDLYFSISQDSMKKKNTLFENVIKYMNETYREDIEVKAFARHVGLSETHFRRLFKEYTGRSPKDFILSLRISQAKESLLKGNSIKETAVLSGFRDMFYFMRMFKKITGVTPGKVMDSLY